MTTKNPMTQRQALQYAIENLEEMSAIITLATMLETLDKKRKPSNSLATNPVYRKLCDFFNAHKGEVLTFSDLRKHIPNLASGHLTHFQKTVMPLTIRKVIAGSKAVNTYCWGTNAPTVDFNRAIDTIGIDVEMDDEADEDNGDNDDFVDFE